MVTSFSLGNIPLPIDVAALANKICDEANLTPDELYCKYEAWALANNKDADVPTEHDLTQLAANIREKALTNPPSAPRPKKNIATSLFYPARPTPTRINVDDFFSYVDGDAPPLPAPASPRARTSPIPQPNFDSPQKHAPAQPSDGDIVMPRPDDPGLPIHHPADEAYANRTASGRVEASLNPELDPSLDVATRPHIRLQCVSGADWRDSRYMNDHVSGRIDSVRTRLKHLGDRILRRLKEMRADDVPPVTPHAFFVSSPNVVMALGRIRVELEEGDGVLAGRINPSSVVLESEDGHLVKLNLTRLMREKKPVFLNPGMVVVVEGVNANGRQIDVHAIYDNAMEACERPPKAKQRADNDGDEIMPNADQQPFANVIVAAGPFTTAANLNYEPFDDLLQVVTRSKPDVVLLAGPFVDSQHEQISQGTPVPFDVLFETGIVARLRGTLGSMRADGRSPPEVVLVPALEDVHHELVCPQPAFRWQQGQTQDPNIHFWANPSVLRLATSNGSHHASFGLTSLPSLQDISADCLCLNKGDRLAAIVSHMIRQCSFYPTFPPSSSVPLDSTFLDRLDVPHMDTSPSVDVIVVPSRLKAFAKCVDGGAVAINPGMLCRGSAGGTYAEVRVPLHLADRPRPVNINADKTQVSIVRL